MIKNLVVLLLVCTGSLFAAQSDSDIENGPAAPDPDDVPAPRAPQQPVAAEPKYSLRSLAGYGPSLRYVQTPVDWNKRAKEMEKIAEQQEHQAKLEAQKKQREEYEKARARDEEAIAAHWKKERELEEQKNRELAAMRPDFGETESFSDAEEKELLNWANELPEPSESQVN